MKELEGKTGVLLGVDLSLGRWGNWSRGPIPTSGQLSESEQKHLRLRVKELIWSSLNGMRIRQSLLQPYIPGAGTLVHRSWELEFGDCGTVPGQGLLLTAERQVEGMWGRRSWWEMPVEESQAMEARQYCWVACSGWNHHHSLSVPTCQHWQLSNGEAGKSSAWGTELQNRTPARGDPLCTWHAEQ